MARCPRRDSGDVIRVVLIAYDLDDLAVILLNALAEDLDQTLATSSLRPGWARNSVVTRVLIGAFLSRLVLCRSAPDSALAGNALATLKLVT